MKELIKIRIDELSAELSQARMNGNKLQEQEIATKILTLRGKLYSANVRNWYSTRKIR